MSCKLISDLELKAVLEFHLPFLMFLL